MVEKLTRERRRAMTRETLIAAAIECFAEQGIEATSLEDIAAKAGLTRGAIYSNFEGKRELILAMVERFAAALVTGSPAAPPKMEYTTDDPIGEWARANVRTTFAAVLEAADWVAVMFEAQAHAVRDPELRQELAALDVAWIEMAEETAREAREHFGTPSEPDDRFRALLGTAILRGAVEMALLDRQSPEVYERVAEAAFRAFATLDLSEAPTPG